jgi:hypothetical protein
VKKWTAQLHFYCDYNSVNMFMYLTVCYIQTTQSLERTIQNLHRKSVEIMDIFFPFKPFPINVVVLFSSFDSLYFFSFLLVHINCAKGFHCDISIHACNVL